MMTLVNLHRDQYSLFVLMVYPFTAVVGTEIKDLHLLKHCLISRIIRTGRVIVAREGITFDVCDEVLLISIPEGVEELVELFTPNHS